MTNSQTPVAFDPVHAATHGYTREDWDDADSPELTAEELAAMKPFSEAEPELYASLMRAQEEARGTAEPVSIPLDPDLLQRLRASGPDWPRRVNDMVRKALDAA